MALVDDKRKALRALELLLLGLSDVASLAATGADEGEDAIAARRSVRRMRFLVVHRRDYERHQRGDAHPHVSRLLDSLPEDVIVVPMSNSPTDEERRGRLLSALGVQLSALPSLFVWQDSLTYDDGEGGTTTIPAGWRAVGIRTKHGARDPRGEWAWLDDAPETDRRRPAKLWARRRAQPPPPEDA